MGMEADTRQAQERELTSEAVKFDLVEALENGGRSVTKICKALGYEADARTLLVTYLVTLCSHARLPGAEIVFEFHQDGILERLAQELEAQTA